MSRELRAFKGRLTPYIDISLRLNRMNPFYCIRNVECSRNDQPEELEAHSSQLVAYWGFDIKDSYSNFAAHRRICLLFGLYKKQN